VIEEVSDEMQSKLTTVVTDWVHGEQSKFWRTEAGLLIKAGMDLQAMDVRCARVLERELGSLSDAAISFAIAELHRQVADLLGIAVPDRATAPDPLRLEVIHRAPPHRGVTKMRGGQRYRWKEAEVNAVFESMQQERPEIIRARRLDLEDWIAAGKPDAGYDPPAGSFAACDAMDAFVLAQRPDIQTMDARGATSAILDRISSEFDIG